MSYIKKSLISDEKIVASFDLHWIVYFSYLITSWLILPFFFFLQALFTEYALTTRRVATKRGIIAVNTEEMRLVKVETVEVKQGIIGRILGYGTVLVTGTGSSYVSMRYVSNPRKVKKQIDGQLDKSV